MRQIPDAEPLATCPLHLFKVGYPWRRAFRYLMSDDTGIEGKVLE